MRPTTFSAIGGWQSFLFCIGMYVVALFFSIFVCSSVFYAFNAKSQVPKGQAVEKAAVQRQAKQELASMVP